MSDYRQLALSDLKAHGLTTDGLIQRYPQEIKRFRLACDMGETGIQLAQSSPGKHPLSPAANAWLELASTWPPQACIAAIDVPTLDSAFESQVREDGLSIQDIPECLQNEALRLVAVKQYGYVLEFIPVSQQTEAIQLAAISEKGAAIRYVPIDQQTEEMRLIAVSIYGDALTFIPQKHRSEAVMCAAVTNDGYALRHIPIEQQTKKIQIAAVSRHGLVLSMIAKNKQSIDVQRAALKQNKEAANHMPKSVAARLLRELNSVSNEQSVSP